MKIFSYKHYIEYIHKLRLKTVMQLAEEKSEYYLEEQKNKYSYDKLIKNILKDKKEAEKIINNFIKPRRYVKENELNLYTKSNLIGKSKEANLVYKLKNQEIFFLIENQTKIDNTTIYRILKYCIDIMQEWNRNKKIKKNIQYPIIVPIVIYTGNQKWKVPINFKEEQINNLMFEKKKINIGYNLIDINKMSKHMLLQQKSVFGYAMLIKKSENKEELLENVSLIIKSTNDNKELYKLLNVIDYLSTNML